MSRSERRRATAAATIGNGLEFYDFVTFAFFAIQIGNTFFPSHDKFVSLMASLATFGAGFISRPIGAFVLGGFADRHGRKPAMMISMLLMGLGITVLALTPGYATIGIAAPIIAVTARLIEGFALGGEVGSATAYMMESVLVGRRGFSISWQGASQSVAATIGALVGLILSQVMSDAELDSYGWRIALLLGAAIVPYALLIRRALPETHVVPGDRRARREPVRPHLRTIVLGIVLIAAGTIGTYFFQYMATFGRNTLKLSSGISFAGEMANNAISVVSVLTGGLVSDRVGRKLVMTLPLALFALLIVPVFLWLTSAPSLGSFIGANLILSGVASFGFGAVYAAISESLPATMRARVFALVYSLPVTVFGGTTQLVITWILHVTGNPMAVAWYLTGVTLIGLSAALLMRESAPVRLRMAYA